MGVAAEVETGNASVVEVVEAAVEVGAEVGVEDQTGLRGCLQILYCLTVEDEE